MIAAKRPRLSVLMLLAGYAAAVVWVSTRSASVVSDRPVTLRLAHWQIERGPPDGIEAVIRRYEEINPRVHVEQVPVPSSLYRQWLRTNLAGGTGTDLVEFAYFIGGVDDIPRRYFEPLTRWIDQPNPYNAGTPLADVPWRQTFVDGLYYTSSAGPEAGQDYAVTLSLGSLRLFVNQRLLEDVSGSAAREPSSIADLLALRERAAVFAKRTGRPVHVLAGARDNATWLIEHLLQGSLVNFTLSLDREGLLSRTPHGLQRDYLSGRWSYREPQLQAAFELVREITTLMKPGFAQCARSDAAQEFLRGEALFIFAGTWDATSLKRLADFPVGAMRFPEPTRDAPHVGPYIRGPLPDGLLATGMAFYLNRTSPHFTEALDFLQFLTSYEAGEIFTAHSGWLSSVRGVRSSDDVETYRPFIDGYYTGASFMSVGPNTQMVFWRNFHRLIGHTGSVAAFATAMEAEMGSATRADLRLEVRNALATARRRDVDVLALRLLDPQMTELADPEGNIGAAQTLSEVQAYQGLAALASPAPVTSP